MNIKKGLSDYWRKIHKDDYLKLLSLIIVFPKEKIIYIKYPKCGRTTLLRTIIDQHYKGEYFFSSYNKDKFYNWIKTITDEELNKYLIFTIVRHPFSRSLSLINYIYKGRISSDDFINKLYNDTDIIRKHHCVPYNLICNNRYIFDYVCIMEENLIESYKFILNKLKIKIDNIPWSNKSVKKQNKLSEYSKKEIYKFYKNDFKLFNFTPLDI